MFPSLRLLLSLAAVVVGLLGAAGARAQVTDWSALKVGLSVEGRLRLEAPIGGRTITLPTGVWRVGHVGEAPQSQGWSVREATFLGTGEGAGAMLVVRQHLQGGLRYGCGWCDSGRFRPVNLESLPPGYERVQRLDGLPRQQYAAWLTVPIIDITPASLKTNEGGARFILPAMGNDFRFDPITIHGRVYLHDNLFERGNQLEVQIYLPTDRFLYRGPAATQIRDEIRALAAPAKLRTLQQRGVPLWPGMDVVHDWMREWTIALAIEFNGETPRTPAPRFGRMVGQISAAIPVLPTAGATAQAATTAATAASPAPGAAAAPAAPAAAPAAPVAPAAPAASVGAVPPPTAVAAPAPPPAARADDALLDRIRHLEAQAARTKVLEEQLAALTRQRTETPAPAAAPTPSAPALKVAALVIGNSQYAAFGKLPNPANDAKAMAERLKALGAQVDLQLDVDRRKLASALGRFQQRDADIDVGILFYAGHGVQIGGVNYLVPVDFAGRTAGEAEIEAIPMSTVLNQVPGRTKLVFLDACRDNPFTQTGTRSVTRGLAAMNVARGTLVAFSTRDGAVAEDGTGRNSPFTHALLEHLADPVDISLVLRRVREKVLRATQGKQEPWDYGSLVGGEVVLGGMARR